VNVTVLIRTEDERLQIGDYVGDQLANLGFTVTRQYGISSVLSPIWRGSDPDLGTWSAYTGGWASTGISRDEGSNFGSFYTPLWAAMGILWAHYTPTPQFFADASALWYNDFTTIAQRVALFQEAIPLSMQDSVRIFLLDRTGFSPLRKNASVANDLAGGIYGCYLWAVTIHFQDPSTRVPIAPAT
jgi:peptide/nickel transport system substrate-binding protein